MMNDDGSSDLPDWARSPDEEAPKPSSSMNVFTPTEPMPTDADLPSWVTDTSTQEQLQQQQQQQQQQVLPHSRQAYVMESPFSSWSQASGMEKSSDGGASPSQAAWCDSDGQAPLLPPPPESSTLFLRPSSIEVRRTWCTQGCALRVVLLPLLVAVGLGNLFLFVFRLVLSCEEYQTWSEAGSMLECLLSGMMTYMIYHELGGLTCCKMMCLLCALFELVLTLCEFIANDCTDDEAVPAIVIPAGDAILFALWLLAFVFVNALQTQARKAQQRHPATLGK